MQLFCYIYNMPRNKEDLLGTPPAQALIPQPGVEQQNTPLAPQSAEVQEALAQLSPEKAAFVLAVCSGSSPADALFSTGWTGKRTTATSTAGRWLREDEAVKDAIAVIKADMAKRAEYDFNKFIAELDEAIAFAIKTENATAYVRAVELKGKASGHIVDKVDQRFAAGGGFSLVIAGVKPPKNADGP